MTFTDDMTLGSAREALYDLVDEGHECPCCHQFAKVYKRQIYSTMARELIRCYKADPHDWFHLPTVVGYNGGDITKVRYWGLLEEEVARRVDGGRAGYWRFTSAGRGFVNNVVAVPRYAFLYDGELLFLKGDDTRIVDSLGKKFDYRELMNS
jgi:hypothetical protein